MPPTKKRRVDEKGNSEDVARSDVSTLKRRKGIKYDPDEICQEIYEGIRTRKTEDGRLLYENFLRVPKRRNEPEYYNVVSNPIDLMKVQNKLKNEEYDDIDEMTEDIGLIVSNSKQYYAEDSQEYSDAMLLLQTYDEMKTAVLARKLGSSDQLTIEPSSSSRNSEDSILHYNQATLGQMDESTNDVLEGDDEADIEETLNPPRIKISFKNTGSENETEQPSPALRPKRKRGRPRLKDIAEAMSARVGTDQEDDHDKEDQASSVTDDESLPYEELFTAIVTAKEGDRVICEMFKVLPNKEVMPGYYEVIEEPMDLKTIAKKIQGNEYTSTDEMFKDLMLMVNNAKSFNEPGSQIYRDSGALRKLIVEKKIEMSQPRPVRSTRSRLRRNQKEKMSAVIAALEYTIKTEADDNVSPSMIGDAAEDASETEGSVVDDSEVHSPLWSLYFAVKKYRDRSGQTLCEPFLRLPNRRVYPDYYEEISKPVTLPKIRRKLRDGQYKTLEKLYDVLETMFENAKRYNVEGSKIYMNAVKLQEVMKAKYKELLTTKQEIFGDSTEVFMKKPKRCFETASATSEEGAGGGTPTKHRSGQKSAVDDVLKRRLWALYKTVYDYQFDGRKLIDIFVKLPSKKDYPNYFQVVSEPIDMTMIESKIKENKYSSDHLLVQDLELMFNNARNYNEGSSQIYKDAETLERILKSKIKSLPPLDGSPLLAGKICRNIVPANPQVQRFHDLYNYIKDYADAKGRILSTPFIKLPPKQDYPDYYEVIKRPIDMMKISQKITSSQYVSLEDMVTDFVQIFDNACKYNEPDSVIYKDALTLQRVCLEKKQELIMSDDGCEVPDVRALVQEMMTNLYISTYNCVDDEGRCYSDSFLELPAAVVVEMSEGGQAQNPKKRPSFQQVKRNLDMGRYRRMDRFQQDMLEVFEYARQKSRSDSQLYEDSVELEAFFIRLRDEICGNGETLTTPALNYTELHLNKAVDIDKRQKQEKEQEEDEKRKLREQSKEKEQIGEDKGEDSYTYNGHLYRVGDFVTIEPREPSLKYHVVLIERLVKDDKGETSIHGNFFLQPQETFHLATRKFLQKEVFKSDKYERIPFSKVTGICYVMSVKEYFKSKPQGIPESELFVCESRYSSRLRVFKKIKIWPVPKNENVEIIPREVSLMPVRVASVFVEKNEVSDCESDEISVLDMTREIVFAKSFQSAEDGNTYYQQLQVAAGWFKIGDFAYVQQMGVKTVITRIDKMWTNSAGDAFIYGPTYVHPYETEHEPTRTFYQREVFKTPYEDTHWMDNILGRCIAMQYKDFITCRPTEIPEKDIYLCEAKYIETEKQIKKFLKPTNMINHNSQSSGCQDEIYFFRKPIIPQKVPSPLLMDLQQSFVMDDSSMGNFDESSSQLDGSYSEGFNLSSGFSSLDVMEQTPPEPGVTKTHRKMRKGAKKGNVSGYIMFAAEFRKDVARSHKDLSFGEVSKIVGQKWKLLEKGQKEIYEALAVKKQAELKAKHAAAQQALKEAEKQGFVAESQSPQTPKKAQPQFTSPQHGLNMNSFQEYHQDFSQTQFIQGGQQYGQAPVSGVTQGMIMVGSQAQQLPQSQTPQQAQQQMAPTAPRPSSPMFVSVPPRTQRLLHSEAYLKYIENLKPERQDVSNWRKQLSATEENTPLNGNGKLPIHWLGNGVGPHENAASALWALRDLMLKDTLVISRTLEPNEIW